MEPQVIIQHHHVHGGSLRRLVQRHWTYRRLGSVPPYDEPSVDEETGKRNAGHVAGSINAYINQGRWVAECPAGCRGAVLAEVSEPYFICPNCGSPENGGNWYRVVFPSIRDDIEAVLLKRPAPNSHFAIHRNWKEPETVEDLRAENLVHEVIVS